MIRISLGFISFLVLLSLATPGHSHELRPGYLELREQSGDTFDVLWKVPARGGRRLALGAELPDNCTVTSPRTQTWAGGAAIERWTVLCANGLAGKKIWISGLDKTLTDVLFRLQHADGASDVQRLTPEAPSLMVAATPSTLVVAKTYFLLGVEHILFGVDHLLFIFALLLLIRDGWMLVKTITAFTVAHSITLALATLGHVAVPQRPVEAVIALSIVFLATELAKDDNRDNLCRRYPWIVAFVFGLLHGLGFAGALSEIGLPQSDIPLALLMFNLGVEAGQLLFVATVLLIIAAGRRLLSDAIPSWRWAPRLAAYAIGCLSAYWLIDRLAGFA